MSCLHSLHTKLSIALFLLFCVIGLLAFAIGRYAADMYHQEITQRLNHDIAKHIAADQKLIANGEPNLPALKQLAHHAMVINPTTEIYLLDPRGKVLGHALRKETVLRTRVDLKPVQKFIDSSSKLPIMGQDPRNTKKQKIFSATPIYKNNQIQGYLYVILGGKLYDSLLLSVQNSYVLTISAIAITLCVIFVFFAGVMFFYLLTRRLGKLTRYVNTFQQGDLHGPFEPPLTECNHNDEINSLMLAFKLMADRISKQFIALQELDRNRRDLITNVSHDLRTPLVSVQGYLETVIIKFNKLNDNEKITYLKKAHNHGRRLRKLISELFELSRLDSNALKPKLEKFHILELLQDLVQDFQYRAQKREVSMTVTPQQGEFFVYADIAMMQRVVENLIENALRYTPKGGNVQVKLEKKEGRVILHIEDSGYGIDSREIPHIFERFYRADQTVDKAKGTGLGLAIVKRILDLHKTSITVNSQLSRGTAFTFSLPTKLQPTLS